MTTSATANAEQGALDEPPFPIVLVNDLLKSFVKAVRAHQLYLPNNPMHARSLETVREAFAAMGAIEFAAVDAGALLENDARVADEFDTRMRLRDVAS